MIFQRVFLRAGVCLIGLAMLAACASGTTVAPTATSAPATATSAPAPAAATSAPATATSAPATATLAPQNTPEAAGEEVTFQFANPLATIEELEDISSLLHNVEGILSVEGNEKNITIMYDPAITDVDKLMQTMETIGFPVKPPE